MNRKKRQVLAITALVFVAICTVSFVLFLAKPDMFGGLIALITMFSGFSGVGLFLYIKIFDQNTQSDVVVEGENDENPSEEKPSDEKPSDEKASEEPSSEGEKDEDKVKE